MSFAESIGKKYASAFDRYAAGDGEEALSEAYELGRGALVGGLGVLDMLALHQSLIEVQLTTARHEDPRRVLCAAAAFLQEALSPFEMHYRRVDESNAAWRRLNESLEEEVKRIARALHDEAGSILAHASLEMDLVTSDLGPEARERLGVARTLLDETGEQLRHLSHELRPSVLDDLGLGPALGFLAEGVAQRTGVPIEVRGGVRERFQPAVELAVYRIVQEALNNAIRHARGASRIAVALECDSESLQCVIADDGQGFDVSAVLGDAHRRGLGLLGMRERAMAAGGECAIRSAVGRGTSVELRMPL